MDAIGRLKLNVDRTIQIMIEGAMRPELGEEAFRLITDHNGYCSVRFGNPHKPRSVGKRSQEAHIRGHEQDIVNQARSHKWKAEQVHQLMKALTVKAGKDFPYEEYRGVMIYASDAEINSLQANALLETIHQFLDENNFYGTEYVSDDPNEPRTYKSLGGRSLAEMMEYQPELNPQYKEVPKK